MFVRCFDGKTITLAVEANDTIDTVKALVKNKEGIPRKHQRLEFAGEPLEDGTLYDYGIADGSVIDLLMRGVGGGISIELKHCFFYSFILGLLCFSIIRLKNELLLLLDEVIVF